LVLACPRHLDRIAAKSIRKVHNRYINISILFIILAMYLFSI
jgi:hypothetical protein